MSIYLKSGHEFRDENGQLVATLLRDVREGDLVESKDFVFPDGSHPKPGDQLPDAVARVLRGEA